MSEERNGESVRKQEHEDNRKRKQPSNPQSRLELWEVEGFSYITGGWEEDFNIGVSCVLKETDVTLWTLKTKAGFDASQLKNQHIQYV